MLKAGQLRATAAQRCCGFRCLRKTALSGSCVERFPPSWVCASLPLIGTLLQVMLLTSCAA